MNAASVNCKGQLLLIVPVVQRDGTPFLTQQKVYERRPEACPCLYGEIARFSFYMFSFNKQSKADVARLHFVLFVALHHAMLYRELVLCCTLSLCL